MGLSGVLDRQHGLEALFASLLTAEQVSFTTHVSSFSIDDHTHERTRSTPWRRTERRYDSPTDAPISIVLAHPHSRQVGAEGAGRVAGAEVIVEAVPGTMAAALEDAARIAVDTSLV
jgi:hypothetical protein